MPRGVKGSGKAATKKSTEPLPQIGYMVIVELVGTLTRIHCSTDTDHESTMCGKKFDSVLMFQEGVRKTITDVISYMRKPYDGRILACPKCAEKVKEIAQASK